MGTRKRSRGATASTRVVLSGLLALSALLGGCASSPPAAFYTLTSLIDAPAGGADLSGATLAVGLGPFSFPRFLDRPQVVRREASNLLVIDEFNRWGGSLDDDFSRVFAENLARLLRTSRIVVFPSELRIPLDFRVTAEILAFEAGPADQAILRVRWAVLDANSRAVLEMREDHYQRGLPSGAGVSAQVSALSATLADFSRDVAEALRRLPRSKPLRGPSA